MRSCGREFPPSNLIKAFNMDIFNMDLFDSIQPIACATFVFCITLLGYRLYFNVPDKDIYEDEVGEGEE
jgi:hypothetical protein